MKISPKILIIIGAVILGAVFIFLTYKQLNTSRPKLPPGAEIINEPSQPPRLKNPPKNLNSETLEK